MKNISILKKKLIFYKIHDIHFCLFPHIINTTSSYNQFPFIYSKKNLVYSSRLSSKIRYKTAKKNSLYFLEMFLLDVSTDVILISLRDE